MVVVAFTMGKGTLPSGVSPVLGLTTLLDTATNEVHLVAREWSSFTDEELEFKVTTLGLDHSLATKWTSFVAVSRRVVNPQTGLTPDGKVPLPMVKGTTTNAYPPSISILGENMAGNSTPEPATVMGMFVVGAAGLVALWFIRRKNRMEGISI